MLLKSLLFFHVDGQDWFNAIAFGGLQPTYGPVAAWVNGKVLSALSSSASPADKSHTEHFVFYLSLYL